MQLVVDIGNTHTSVGLLDGEHLAHTFRVTTAPRTTDELCLLLSQLLASRSLPTLSAEGAIISSVVPGLVHPMEKALERLFGVRALVVGRGVKTGMKVRTDNPREVGADRIVNAVAARHGWGSPVVVVALGTATTVDCVNAAGEYVGGAIAPGFQISEEALFAHTAQLPRVALGRPPHAIGTNTAQAVQSGLYYGYLGLVEGLATRCRDELGGRAQVVATGALAALLGERSAVITQVDRDLTLRGLALLAARNRG